MSNHESDIVTQDDHVVVWRRRIYWPKNIFELLLRESKKENRELHQHVVHIVERHFADSIRKEG